MSEAPDKQPICQRCGSPGVLRLFRPLELWLCEPCYQRERQLAFGIESRATGQFDNYDLAAVELDFDNFDNLDDLKAALSAAFKRAHEKEEGVERRAQAARRAARDQLKAYVIFFAAPSLVLALVSWLFRHATFMGALAGWLGLQAMLWLGAAWFAFRDWHRR